MKIQNQLEIQGVTQQWVTSLMAHNNIDAITMCDALNNVIVQLKSQIITDLLIEIQDSQNQEVEDDTSNQ